MKVKRIEIIRSNIKIPFAGITLLSSEAYERYKEFIPPLRKWWWLRTPGLSSYFVSSVNSDGDLSYNLVNSETGNIRPVLFVEDRWSNPVRTGLKIEVADHTWTAFNRCALICDDSIGMSPFRKKRSAEDANVYEVSDVAKWLNKWVEENHISFEEKK